MIDYIKIDVSYLDRNAINENEYLKFNDTYCREDGVVYKSKAQIFNLTFTVTPTMIIMEGSLHKYYNIMNELENQNFTQFTYDQILWVINDLKQKFGISPERTKILNIEYGVNLGIDEPPSELLQSKVIFYKSIYPNYLDFKGNGYFQEFNFREYKIKMYDKGAQYHIPENILRFEVRTKKSRIVGNKFGIRYLGDLCDADNLIKLHQDLVEKMNDVYIYDDTKPVEEMTELENHLYIKSQAQSFFLNMKGRSKYNQVSKAKIQLKCILSKYNLNKTHISLLQKLELKKYELLLKAS